MDRPDDIPRRPVRAWHGVRFGSARRRWPALLAVFVCGGMLSTGQAQREPSGGIDAVYLDVDAAAAKKLAAARELLAARQWNDGIDLVRQIGDQHGDRLVGITPGRYVSVRTYCDILLSALPDEGLKLYRARVDPQAKRWLAEASAARDMEGLQRIVRRAFLSSSGDDALLLLGDLAWEQGNLSQARGYWEQLLPLEAPPEAGQLPPLLRYPASGIDEAQVKARLVLCSLLQGQTERGQAELEEFRKTHPRATGKIAGRGGILADTLASLAATAGKPSFPSDAAHVRTFAGNPRRNDVVPYSVDVGSVQWSAPLQAVRVDSPLRGEDVVDRFPFPDRAERGPVVQTVDVLSCHPVVYNNLVLYCDETSVYARELISAKGGRPAWGQEAAIYRHPAELPKDGPAPPPARVAGLPQFTVSLDGNRLYARLGSPASRARNRGLPGHASMMVSLDLARQGDLVWALKADEIDPGQSWTFDGAPLAADGRVYVALRRREPQLQVHVACFDAESARLLWNRKICLGLDPFGPDVEEVEHQLLTLADDRLYCCTNLGAVAALEARTGLLHWVASYPRADVDTRAEFNKRRHGGPNPCVYHDGVIFAAPADSDHLLAFDAETGLVQWDRELKGNVHQLVGVEGGKLIAAGNQLWGLDVETGRLAWPPNGRIDREAATYGRCAIGGGLVYWPRREEILIVDVATGQTRRKIDLVEQHRLRGGGNITLADGMLLLAQVDRLYAFSEYGALRKRREQQLALTPDDPRALCDLGLVAEAMNDAEAALAAYAQVRARSAPDERRDGGPLGDLAAVRRGRLLLRLGLEAQTAGNLDLAIARLTAAAETPAVPAVQRDAQLALARACEQRGQFAHAVTVWQGVLDAAAARPAMRSEDRAAMRLARDEIGRLIADHGREVYASVEHSAEQAFAEALETRDPSRGAGLLARYPHAASAAAAGLKFAAMQRAAGDFHASDRTYRTLADSGAPGETRAAALAGLARSAEDRHAWRSAARWWRALYDQHAAATIVIDDERHIVHDFVPDRLAKLPRESRSRSGAEGIAPVLNRQWEREISAGVSPLLPEGDAPSQELDCVLLGGLTVTCLNAGDGAERWRIGVMEPPLWAGFLSDLLVMGTATGMAGVAPHDGTIVWQQSFGLVPGGDSVSPVYRLAGERVVCLRGDREVCSVLPDTGEVDWRYQPSRGVLQRHFLADGDRILVQLLAPNRWQALDASEGTVLTDGAGPDEAWGDDPVPLQSGRWAALRDGSRRPQVVDLVRGTVQCTYQGPFSIANARADLLGGDSAVVAVVDGNTLARFDPSTGRRLWSCRAGTGPLVHARMSCLDAERLYVAAAGVLRAVSLEDGRMAWEQYVGRDGEWRVERTGPWLAAWRIASPDRASVVLCDPASGEFIERLNVDCPAGNVRFRSAGNQAVLVTDTRLVGWQAIGPSED